MNPIEKINGELVTSISAIRSELRKQGIPTFRAYTISNGRVGSVSSSRKNSTTKYKSGIELVRTSFGTEIKTYFTHGDIIIYTEEQVQDFLLRAKAIVKEMN